MEADPNGFDAHSPGAKLDLGKNRLGLVIGGFAKAIQQVGKVGTYGANKYCAGGWEKVENGRQRYSDALMRHILKHMEGEVVDPDSGLTHLSHVAWNALAILEIEERTK